MTNFDEPDDEVAGAISRDEPPGADGVVDDPEAEDDADSPGADDHNAGVDMFLDNAKRLFKNGGEDLLLIWVGIVILMALPAAWKLAHGYDPFAPFSFETDTAALVVELVSHAGAVVLFVGSLPMARDFVIDYDEENPPAFDDLFDHIVDAAPAALVYYGIVVLGLMMCIIPGVLAAVYLAPALYLTTARDESMLRAFMKAPGQFSNYSHLYAIVVVGGIGTLFVISLALGMAISSIGGTEAVAEAAGDPLMVVGFSLGFIVATAMLYVFYVGMLAIFTTIDIDETG